MIRTLKEATVNRYYFRSHEQLSKHRGWYLMAYNIAKRLKSLIGLTPFEFLCSRWEKEAHRFKARLYHLIEGLNT